MAALFLKLLNMSISASWLVLAVVVLRFLMKKAPKWMTCALWALVALRLVLPFSIESTFSLVPEPISNGQVVENLSDTYWGNTQILHNGTSGYQAAVEAGREPVAIGNGHYYVVTASDGISEPPTVANTVVPVLSNIWILGVAVLLFYAAVSYLLIHRKVSVSLCLRENIYLCDYIESPFILGILRPRIYLPSTLDQSQWPHVIAHEQAHLHRKDHWWKPLGFAILCVYWFNPVLWLAYILLCRDIELACDERVIRDMDTRQKQDYTAALLECSMPRYLVAACPLAFGEVGVKERVKTVLNYKKPAFWIVLIALILCIAAAVCFLTDPVNSTIAPGIYHNVETTVLQSLPNNQNGQAMAVQYILQDNTLYCSSDSGITVIGKMTSRELDEDELRSYLRVRQNPLRPSFSVSQALWRSMDNETFYLLFRTDSGDTYLAIGWEDLSERFTDSDDTYIAQLGRLELDNDAEEMELAWFDATILEASDTSLLVSPVTGSWNFGLPNRIVISHSASIPSIDWSEGDNVRIVFNGQVQETYPEQISHVYSITKLPALAPQVQYGSIEDAILDGCVAMVNSDTVAGKDRWNAFIQQAQQGQAASVRLVRYYTLSDPGIYHDSGDFADAFRQYPMLDIYELRFDGTQYTLRVYGDGSERISVWDHLVHYSNVTHGRTYSDYYVLTNTPNLSWNDYWESIAVSFTAIRSHSLYSDILHPNEPSHAELEAVKASLEPYMQQYQIQVLDANELTHRLDVRVSGWVDGLDALIEQYIDMDFVTVTYLEDGSITLDDRNALISRFPDYFGLNTFQGLELYALEDGYVLMAGTNRVKTEDEIHALPRASAAEMKQILQSYQPGIVLDIGNIFIENRTGRTEYDIRKELGIFPSCQVSVEITNSTATEALVTFNIFNLDDNEVWTGYNYHLEVLIDEGWVHYGYPPEDLAWEEALLFDMSNSRQTPPPTDFQGAVLSHDQVVFAADWSRTADAPLPPGTYRYCKGITIKSGDEIRSQSCYAIFTVPDDSPEDPGIHMEIMNPTDTGATLAITYNGGLMGELSTGGQYYLMVNVGNDAMTKYGRVPSQVDWDDVRYSLMEGETVYLDVRWDHTADAPLPPGSYYVVLTVDQAVPYAGSNFYFTKYITEPFAIID